MAIEMGRPPDADYLLTPEHKGGCLEDSPPPIGSGTPPRIQTRRDTCKNPWDVINIDVTSIREDQEPL